MALSPETARRLSQASEAQDHREIRIRFESRDALLDAFALAQKESWIEDCHVVLSSLELVVRTAGGFALQPRRAPAPRRRGRAQLSVMSQAC
jgi:hypothetical protein